MKLLIFGTGMIVDDFLHGVHELPFKEVYLCGRNKNKVDELSCKYPVDKIFYDVEAALASDAYITYVGLPNNLHFEYAKKSLEAGKHVIVEKPFMSTATETQKIYKIAKENEKFAFEASLVFYFPAYKSMVKDLPSLGEIHLADCNFSQYSSRYDRFLNDDIAPALNIKNCGGALMDLNVYNINLMVGLFGKPESVSYAATIKKDIDVSGIVVLNYKNSKASCAASKATSAPRHILLQGEKGSLYLPQSMSRAYNYNIEYNDGTQVNRDFMDNHHRMFHEFIEFVRVIEKNDTTTFSKLSEQCLLTSKILDACRKDAGICWLK